MISMRAIAVAAVVCSISIRTADAQAPTQKASREQANALFLEGRELLTKKKDTKAACEKFEASIAIDPAAPGVMLNLGLCYELLEKYATSLYWFRKAQSAAAEAKLPAYETEAKRHTVELATKVSTVKIDVTAAPHDTEIRIGGKLVEPTDYARVEVDSGTHTFEARATGKQVYSQTFEVTGRDAGTLTVPAMIDEQRPISATAPIARSPDSSRKVLAAAFAGAGLVACVVSPIWASRIKSNYDEAVANMEMPSWDAARNRQHIATGVFVAGLALIGFGTYLYLTAPSGEPGAVVTAVAPVVGADQVGFVVSGSL